MSQLVKIAKLKHSGKSLDEIAAALELEDLSEIKMIERVGRIAISVKYRATLDLAIVAREMHISVSDIELIDEVYGITKATHAASDVVKKITLKDVELPFHEPLQQSTKAQSPVRERVQYSSRKISGVRSRMFRKKSDPKQSTISFDEFSNATESQTLCGASNLETKMHVVTVQEQPVPQKTVAVQDEFAYALPLNKTPAREQILPQQIPIPNKSVEKITQIYRAGTYALVAKTMGPLLSQMFLDANDVIAYMKYEKGVDVPMHVARNYLNDETKQTYGERVRDWATKYVQQHHSLVEIARLLGNMHIYTADKLLRKLNLRDKVENGFDKIDSAPILAKMPPHPWIAEQLTVEQREIMLICKGASFKEIAAVANYKPTRAGERIRELGLYEIWQCANFLQKTGMPEKTVYYTI